MWDVTFQFSPICFVQVCSQFYVASLHEVLRKGLLFFAWVNISENKSKFMLVNNDLKELLCTGGHGFSIFLYKTEKQPVL